MQMIKYNKNIVYNNGLGMVSAYLELQNFKIQTQMKKEQNLENITEQALNIPVVMLRLKEKLKEYKVKRDNAKSVCDKQKFGDVSFQAEVEDEVFLLADRQYIAVRDLYEYVTNAT